MTTATLAEQLAGLAQSLPAISSQLEAMEKRQTRVESISYEGRAYSCGPGPSAALSDARRCTGESLPREVSPNHRESDTARPVLPIQMVEDEPVALPSDPDYVPAKHVPSATDPSLQVSDLLLQQSQALTTLVAHLASGDGLHDFGSSTSSTSLSLRGSTKREKLIGDLSARKG